MKRPPDTLLASQGKRIAYEDAIASYIAATIFRSCAGQVAQNQRLRKSVLNAALPGVHAQRASVQL
jgi:hypothetical protein